MIFWIPLCLLRDMFQSFILISKNCDWRFDKLFKKQSGSLSEPYTGDYQFFYLKIKPTWDERKRDRKTEREVGGGEVGHCFLWFPVLHRSLD
jgi:hypothetical protein